MLVRGEGHRIHQNYMASNMGRRYAAVRVWISSVDIVSIRGPGSIVPLNVQFPPICLGQVCQSFDFLPADARYVFTDLGTHMIMTRQ